MIRWMTIWIALLAVLPASAQEANDELVKMVLEFAADEDKDIRGVAFEQVRNEAKGAAATREFAGALADLPLASQAGMISALADRGDAAAKPAVKQMLRCEDNSVFLAAVLGLGKLGDASDVPAFVRLLGDGDSARQAAAHTALTQLQGDGVSTAIVQQLRQASSTNKTRLIKVLAARRAMDTIPELLKLAQGSDAKLRAASMVALGEIAGPDHIPGMVQAVLKAVKGNERNAAEKCVMFVCRRIEDPDRRALPLLDAMNKLGRTERVAMLQTLGRVGGEPAWKEIKQAIASRNAATHLAGIRGISNWPDASVANELLRIARSDRHPDHRRIARMSLLRIAPLPDGRTDLEKLALLKTSMKLAANSKETNYGIRRCSCNPASSRRCVMCCLMLTSRPIVTRPVRPSWNWHTIALCGIVIRPNFTRR